MERFSLVLAGLLILDEFVVQQLHNQEPSLNNSKDVLFLLVKALSKGACRCKYHPYGFVFLFFVFRSLRLFHNCSYDIKTYGLLFSVSTQINVFFNIIDLSLLLSCK